MRNERDFMDVILLRQLCSRQFKFSRVCTSFVLLSVLLMFVIRAWWWLNKPKHKTSEYFILPLCCVRLFWVKNYSKKRYLHFNYLTLLHHVSWWAVRFMPCGAQVTHAALLPHDQVSTDAHSSLCREHTHTHTHTELRTEKGQRADAVAVSYSRECNWPIQHGYSLFNTNDSRGGIRRSCKKHEFLSLHDVVFL